MRKVDVCIIGGGMVGATLACGLANHSDLSVLLVEAHPLKPTGSISSSEYRPSYDARSTALSRGTAQIFQQLGCWDSLRQRVAPILDIHVSEKGQFGFSRLNAAKARVPALGYVVENAWLGAVLTHHLFQHSNITIESPAKLGALTVTGDDVAITLEREGKAIEAVSAQLLIAADGQHSQARQMLGIDVQVARYGQTAIIANVSPDRAHRFIAYERFTKTGPLALLPLQEERYGLVWTLAQAEAEQVLALSDEAFLSKLQTQFGRRVGQLVKVGQRFSYPLERLQAQEQIRPRVVVVGNAAHTLHPIAGQGFNLAARDVAELAALLKASYRRGHDLGGFQLLQQYWHARQLDQEKVIQFSDKLLRLFGSDSELLRAGRNFGLIGFDLWEQGKGLLTKHAMGANQYVSLL